MVLPIIAIVAISAGAATVVTAGGTTGGIALAYKLSDRFRNWCGRALGKVNDAGVLEAAEKVEQARQAVEELGGVIRDREPVILESNIAVREANRVQKGLINEIRDTNIGLAALGDSESKLVKALLKSVKEANERADYYKEQLEKIELIVESFRENAQDELDIREYERLLEQSEKNSRELQKLYEDKIKELNDLEKKYQGQKGSIGEAELRKVNEQKKRSSRLVNALRGLRSKFKEKVK